MSINREKALDYLQRSGLVDPERLQKVIAELGDEADADQVLLAFETAGLITAWHRERLLEGKTKGFVLGKYRILSPLGAGAMGHVFLAEHKVMRHRVALKVLARKLVSKPSNVARFEREARAAAAISHTNVVRAFDIDHEGDIHYLVMEYVQGDNLQRVVRKGGPLEPEKAADYARQVARGLHEAHRCGLIHRDIKPSNLLLETAGAVKILDLGLARLESEVEALAAEKEQGSSKLIGTVDYLAPEQAKNSQSLDGRADIYSLGCTLYYLLTGSAPFPSGTLAERVMKHRKRRPMDIAKRRFAVLKERNEVSGSRLHVPDGLIEICNRMMEKSPEKRFQNAGEAADALTEFLEGRYRLRGMPEHLLSMESDDGLGSLSGEFSLSRLGIPKDDEKSPSGATSSPDTTPRKTSSAAERSSVLDEFELALAPDESNYGIKSGQSNAAGKSNILAAFTAKSGGASQPGGSAGGSRSGGSALEEQLVPLGPANAVSIHAEQASSSQGSAGAIGSGTTRAREAVLAGDTATGRSSATQSNPTIRKPQVPSPSASSGNLKVSAPREATKPSASQQNLPTNPVRASWENRPANAFEGINAPLWMLVGAGLFFVVVLIVGVFVVSNLKR